MRVSDFDFELPTDRIALRPVSPRDAARLLVVDAMGRFSDQKVRALPDLLQAGDLLVFNDTRVIPARLSGVRERNGSKVPVQATLLRRVGPHLWTALMKPGKRLRVGDPIVFSQSQGVADALGAVVQAKGEDGVVTLGFDREDAALDQAVGALGVMPLPPYIAAQRSEDDQDRFDYQTVYAKEDGSVAAPTAGLHFTPALLVALQAKGVACTFVTLHVGAGTFLPVKVDDVADHTMHAETGHIASQTADMINQTKAAGGRIICVGTTALRLVESAVSAQGEVKPFSGETSVFITPGFRFRVADVLMTNFHLPRSTLLMLLSAFVGLDRAKTAYVYAIDQGYRFYSYGDAGLWFKAESP